MTIIFNRFALVAIREIREMTQADLARVDSRSSAYISQLESGDRTNPTLETISTLAAGLGVDPRALYVEIPA